VTSVFLDTGYVIALEAADDQYHDAAVQHWRGLTNQLPPLVTTSYVFDEVVTFFNSRNRHAKASEIGNACCEVKRCSWCTSIKHYSMMLGGISPSIRTNHTR